MIESKEQLISMLTACQQNRDTSFVCQLSPRLTAMLTDAAIDELLVTALPMVQGLERRIVRSRGRGVSISGKLRYREGVRMLDHFTDLRWSLTDSEFWRLADAGDICMEALRQDGEEECFRYVFDWICRNIRYVHTAPGKNGYNRLVGAAGVLEDRQANCQGFADVLYLLCGICGIEAGYCCGLGMRQLHVWNRVRINGQWREVDASKGARLPQIDILPTKFSPEQKNTTQDEKNVLYSYGMKADCAF